MDKNTERLTWVAVLVAAIVLLAFVYVSNEAIKDEERSEEAEKNRILGRICGIPPYHINSNMTGLKFTTDSFYGSTFREYNCEDYIRERENLDFPYTNIACRLEEAHYSADDGIQGECVCYWEEEG